MKKTQTSSLSDLESLFAALSESTRLRLLNLMSAGELCVCFFVDILDQPQPTISRHLAYLRKAGLVADRRDGKWIHYRITAPTDPLCRRLFEDTLTTVADQEVMKRDLRSLRTACCSPRAAEIIRRAPKPDSVAIDSQA